METLRQDLRYGFRTFLKNPGFTIIAVIALTLGIGANTAIFSVVNAVLLKPLPFAESEKLVAFEVTNSLNGNKMNASSYPDFADWRSQNRSFEQAAAYRPRSFTITENGDSERVEGCLVTSDLFPLLRVQPILGRVFTAEEEKPGATLPVVISKTLWERRFGSDPNIVGKTVTLTDKPYLVVGVTPASFRFPLDERSELWTSLAYDMQPIDAGPPMTAQRGNHYLGTIARLKPDVDIVQAQADINAIAAGLEKQYQDTNAYKGVRIVSLHEQLVGDIRPALLVLLAAVGAVLLIACANVANLLLARAASRHKEMAVRAALGASRWRVVRQLLTESLLLSFVGGAVGLLLALWGVDLLVKMGLENIPRLAEVAVNARVLGFTFLISLVTGIVFGIVPALQSSKVDLTEALKEGGRSSTDGQRRNRMRNILVVSEVALTLMLLIVAGLLIRSFDRLLDVNPGFDPENVVTLRINVPMERYNDSQLTEFYNQLLPRVRALPGVESASAGFPLPLSGNNIGVVFYIEGQSLPQRERPSTDCRSTMPGYFRAMGIPMLKGRDFTEQDSLKSNQVVIINETLAKRYFPGTDPIGKRISPSIAVSEEEPMREIVAVVGDVKHRSLSIEARPEVYIPFAQIPFSSMGLAVRSKSDPSNLINAVRDEVKQIDKNIPIFEVKTLQRYVDDSLATARFNTLLIIVFAGVALILTAVGLYGVMSYSVAQRTHEIGIRMALGAETRDVLRMVIGQGMALAAVGAAVGLIGAVAFTRLVSSLLYGVGATDPITFAAIAVLLLGVAFFACWIPARRATKVDPMVALRYE